MRTDVELRHLRVFVTVVDVGAHTRAARLLGVSQSTVSETLSALERTLGTALFRKTSKGPALTRAGDALLPYARRILALTGEAVTEVAAVSTRVGATLVVAAVESLCAYVLPPRLAALRERWANVRVELVSAACADIVESVAAGRSDLGLLLEAASDEEDDATLARARLLVVSAPGHPLVDRIASPGEVHRSELCMGDAAGSYHQLLRQYFGDAGLPAPRTRTLGTVEGVKRGVLADAATLGVLPAHAVERELREGVLREIRLAPPLPAIVLRAVRGDEGQRSPVVDALVESLRGLPLGSPGR